MASFFNVPSFDDRRPRYAMHEFKGRAWHFYRATNPALMLENDDSIALHKKRVQEFTELKNSSGGTKYYDSWRGKVPYTDAELWYSRSVLEGCVHPVTGNTIFPFFRFSAFAPLNLMMVPFMLAPSTLKSKTRTLFAHMTNQTLNAVVNYANRSSDDIGLEKLLAAYAAALVSSCSLGLAASKVMSKITDANSLKATLVRATLPFTAVVSAGLCNLTLMRSEEWFGKGVPVRAAVAPMDDPSNDDNCGELLGYSQTAGKLSIAYCAGTRIMLNVMVMMFPPLVVGAVVKKFATLRNNAFLARQAETLILGSFVLGAVPPSLALMKPVVTIPVDQLEANFQNLTDKNGRTIENVTFYKGL